LGIFIPLCCNRIKTELASGAGADYNESISSLQNLLWYLNILRQVVYQAGGDLIDFEGHLMEVIDLLLKNEIVHKKVYKVTSKLISSILESLCNTYPIETSSKDPEQWAFYEKNHYFQFHSGSPKEKFEIKWYQPQSGHINFAIRLLDNHFKSSMDELEELFRNKPELSTSLKIKIAKKLTILKCMYSGCTTLIVGSNTPPSNSNHPLKNKFDVGKKFVSCGYAICDTNAKEHQYVSAIFQRYSEFLHDAVQYFKANNNDDVETIKIIVKSLKFVLYNRGLDYNDYDSWLRGFAIQKRLISINNSIDTVPRHLLVKRVYLYQLLCYKKNSWHIKVENYHRVLLNDLVELSLSEYSEVRK
jgi:proteasome activator subunit 4